MTTREKPVLRGVARML